MLLGVLHPDVFEATTNGPRTLIGGGDAFARSGDLFANGLGGDWNHIKISLIEFFWKESWSIFWIEVPTNNERTFLCCQHPQYLTKAIEMVYLASLTLVVSCGI